MSEPKRHHYLPQFYLEQFCRDGSLWVFDRDTSEFRPQTPKNTALISHYYSVEDEAGNKRTGIESLLSQLEGYAKPIMAKLLAQDAITESDKEEFSIFVAFMMNRVPDFEKSVNAFEAHLIKRTSNLIFSDEKRVQAIMDRMERETGKRPEISAKKLAEFHKRGEYTIEMHRNESLRLMLDLSMDLACYFQQMDWVVFHVPPKTSFITTDNPVVLVPPVDFEAGFYGVGIITKGARKLFPLSQTTCLIMGDRGDRVVHRDVDRQSVRSVNLTLAGYSDRFVIGRDESLVRNMVASTRLTEWKNTGRFRIG